MFSINNRCVIISGSPTCCEINLLPNDYVIACDKGYEHAKNLNITPNLIVGDFDSYSGDLDINIEVIRSSSEKDDTDTLLAVKYALAKGFKDFILVGATKGRLDHQMANISTCAFIAAQGGLCQMVDDETIIYAIKDTKLKLEKRSGYSVSVLSFTDISSGVTLNGLKYPLNNVIVSNLFPIGVSNEFVDDYATIEVKSGILIIVLSSLAREKKH